MADTKISALTAVGTPAGTDEFAVNQSAASKKETLAQVKAFTLTSPPITGGSATAASWPTIASGTLLTTPEAGALEYDGTALYGTRASGERGVLPAEQLITISGGDYVTAGGTTVLQKLFNAPTNGQLTVAGNTAFMFECLFRLANMSASTGTFSFGFGGSATISSIMYWCWNRKTAAGTGTAANFVVSVSAAATVLNATNTTQTGHAILGGKIVVSTGGTIIPSFAISVAAACSVGQDSYFRIWPMGANTVASVGNWS